MSYYRTGPYLSMGPTLTPRVKYIVIACAVIFLLQAFSPGQAIEFIFGLVPSLVLTQVFIWQLGTYIFLHGSFMHLLLNMFVLWMFGCELERFWGSREFLRFFLVTGIGAGILSTLVSPFSQVPIIGASGSIYGILMAYWFLFPERLVLLWFLFPVKVKYFVPILGVLAFLSALTSSGGPIAHMAHLGGMLFAFLYLKNWLSLSGIRQAYYRWRLKRMRERFRVYDSERRKREDDFWIN